MIEIPEANVLANQMNATIHGKRIQRVIAAHSPHKFAWYAGDPAQYQAMLVGKTIGLTRCWGGLIETQVDGFSLVQEKV